MGALFIPEKCSLPVCCNPKDKFQYLELSHDNLRVTYKGEGNSNNDAASVRADKSVSPACGAYYYEVEVVDRGREGFIGLGWCTRTVSLKRLPGWDRNSYGYHGDDGKGFRESGQGAPFGPTFTTGDTIGCGINFIDQSMFFTKNGLYIGAPFKSISLRHSIFPCVGLRTPGEVIHVNFGKEPFLFDINDYFETERMKVKQIWSDQVLIGGNPSDGLVLNYLKHSGYSKTAKAFAEVIGAPSSETDGVDARRKVCDMILDGNCDEVRDILDDEYPGLLEAEETGVLLALRTQQFIEYIRQGDIQKAVEYGQLELSRYVNMGVSSKHKLQDVFSLLVIDNPEQSELLSQTHREYVSSIIGTAIVVYEGGKEKSELELLLRHNSVCIGILQSLDVGPSACLFNRAGYS